LGVDTTTFAALACVCYYCRKRRRFRAQATQWRSSYFEDPKPETQDVPSSVVAFASEVPSSESMGENILLEEGE